ncbi:MAG: hypothetical protein JXQ73_10210 [Phycisphaerae bacterium]|nr:hypothetical protein [Phycisphaerae bacterium]
MSGLNRREMLGGLAAGAASVSIFGADELRAAESCTPAKCSACPSGCAGKTYKNADFYTPDGKFNVEAAKKAYYDMMTAFNYPIPPRLHTDDFWTLDFGLGRFTEVGMAGIFWINNLKDNYFGHEIYLLPGQMIPEHAHLKTEKTEPKLEGWHVRYGWVYIYGEGEPTPGVEERIPPTHRKVAKARTEKILKPGECACLGKACEKHWMRAGPQGAIVSEYATAHDMAGLKFTHPDVKL